MKMAAKILLARFPLKYSAWRKLGGFVHGNMDTAAYALSVFKRHYELANPPIGFNMLEFGPGDSAASALIAHAFGAETVWLVDVGDFATREMEVYRKVAAALNDAGLRLDVDLSGFDGMVASCNAKYITNGLEGMNAIPNGSVDFLWSQAVLEHVRKAELPATFHQFNRVLRESGNSTHRVDFKDHLGGGLNNLRFSEKVWESRWMSTSGFYTNRVRLGEMTRLLVSAGFKVEAVEVEGWASLPIQHKALAPAFQCLPEAELLLRGAFLVATPSKTADRTASAP